MDCHAVKGARMTPTNLNLTKKRDKLKKSAKAATVLAAAERALADQQHQAASELENLADELRDQVVAAEAEISEVQASGVTLVNIL